MTDPTIIDRLRANLDPKGSTPYVILRCSGNMMAMHHEFIIKCIDELEQMPVRAHLGYEPTNLEKLAYQLLLDSAYIVPDSEYIETKKEGK